MFSTRTLQIIEHLRLSLNDNIDNNFSVYIIMEKFDRNAFDEIFSETVTYYDHNDNNCKHNFLLVDGISTCINCGTVEPYKLAFYETLQAKIYKSYYIYHRKSYFREKLRLLVGIKQSSNPDYNEIIKKLSLHQFEYF